MLRVISVVGGLNVLVMVTDLFSGISDVQMPMESVVQTGKWLLSYKAY